MNKAETTGYPDEAFCTAMVTEGLGRFDILFDAVRDMYNAKNHAGIDRLMDLCLGTGNKGYVRTVAAAVKPVREYGVSKEKFERLINFFIEGNEERKRNGWVPVRERLPELDEEGFSREVLVKLYDEVNPKHDIAYFRRFSDGTTAWSIGSGVLSWREIPN